MWEKILDSHGHQSTKSTSSVYDAWTQGAAGASGIWEAAYTRQIDLDQFVTEFNTSTRRI